MRPIEVCCRVVLTALQWRMPALTRRRCSRGVLRPAYPEGGSDAYSGSGDVDGGDGLDGGTGSGPDVRSGLSGLPACVHPGGQLLRMPLHVAASVQRVGIGPRGTVRHPYIFRERGRAHWVSAASPRLLKLSLLRRL